ncbi:MAG: hypothetical protein SGI77_09630 [Pirellulaceae bacterium]|nr:hypothetical protein [Pirellulaceae bacterium]
MENDQQSDEAVVIEKEAIIDLGEPQTSSTASDEPRTSTANPSTNKIFIDVVGDVFIENFIWQQTAEADRAMDLPYTWPDELRNCESTARFRELSGTPLHADIFKEMLAARAASEELAAFAVQSYPPKDMCKPYTRLIDGGPFPVYLNELAPFRVDSSIVRRAKKVWRIASSYGELRSTAIRDTLTAKKLEAIELPVAKEIEDSCEALRESVEAWLTQTLPLQKRTVIVVNDRNAIKEQDSSTSVRSMFTKILEKIDQQKLKDLVKTALQEF